MKQADFLIIIQKIHSGIIENNKATNVMKFQSKLYLLNMCEYVEFENETKKQYYQEQIRKYYE